MGSEVRPQDDACGSVAVESNFPCFVASYADIMLGYGPLLRDYVYFLLAKLAFHRQHPEFNGTRSLPLANNGNGLFRSRIVRIRGVYKFEVH